MAEALIGFFVGVAGTYLAIIHHYEDADANSDLKAILDEIETEAPEGERA